MEEFHTVVVGSGFGGSVVADRVASAERSVLVLERGRPYPPGSFPRTPMRAKGNFWDPRAGLYGLFDIRAFRGFSSVTASGLGGGSLIYANVMLRDERRGELDEHYDRVEAVQAPVEYPYVDSTPKTRAMRDAAAAVGVPFRTPPLAVVFAAPGEEPRPGAPLPFDEHNLHGVARRTCTLCGSCDVGCNDGAKQTLDHTFLSRAHAAGATIRCCCEARAIAPHGDGRYRVTYVQHLEARNGTAQHLVDGSDESRRTVLAEHVVLAAGTFGSTGLLLRNRASLPRLSAALGTRFCTNGDVLAFVRRTAQPLEPTLGPVITAAAGTGERMVQDAGAPALGEWAWQALDGPRGMFAAIAAEARRRMRRDTALGEVLAAGFGSTHSAATMPLLGMGRDEPTGRISLRGEGVDVNWHERDSRAHFAALEHDIRRLGRALGARRTLARAGRLVTVHPLGGCPMGRDADDGVVDDAGNVFGYPGLHVADGSILPGPVGVNPSFTIAALADRAADALLAT